MNSNAFLAAAESIETGAQSYSCHAIAYPKSQFRPTNLNELDFYELLFKENEWDSWLLHQNSAPTLDFTHLRVTLLCMAAACAEDADLFNMPEPLCAA